MHIDAPDFLWVCLGCRWLDGLSLSVGSHAASSKHLHNMCVCEDFVGETNESRWTMLNQTREFYQVMGFPPQDQRLPPKNWFNTPNGVLGGLLGTVNLYKSYKNTL